MMNTNWQAFLEERGAQLDEAVGVVFPQMPIEADCALCALGDIGLIGVSGDEATSFLQGQVSNDLRELTEQRTQLNSHCNAKGRMLANFRILQAHGRYLLILPREQVAKLLPRLKMFVLRAQVELTDLSDELACFGLIGGCLSDSIHSVFDALPEADNEMVAKDGGLVIRVAGPLPRWLFVGPDAMAAALWQDAEARGALRAGSDLWALQDIRAGIPVIRAATSERFVPQMANMQIIDGVSFHKGCYTGQEVVARMQYLGKLKRRMYLTEARLDSPPAPGTPIRSSASRSEQGAGAVVDARLNAAGLCEILAVAEIAAAEQGDVELEGSAAALELRPPPYGFPALENEPGESSVRQAE